MKTYTVFWTHKAKMSLQGIYDFLSQSSQKGAYNIVTGLVEFGEKLNTLPNRYPLERNLQNLPLEYRSAIKWNYKLIYTVDANTVYVVEVFDVRQDPSKMKV